GARLAGDRSLRPGDVLRPVLRPVAGVRAQAAERRAARVLVPEPRGRPDPARLRRPSPRAGLRARPGDRSPDLLAQHLAHLSAARAGARAAAPRMKPKPPALDRARPFAYHARTRSRHHPDGAIRAEARSDDERKTSRRPRRRVIVSRSEREHALFAGGRTADRSFRHIPAEAAPPGRRFCDKALERMERSRL